MQILIHVSEIALKGKNRAFFENKLRDNITTALKPRGIKKMPSVFIVDAKSDKGLENVFGIAHYAIIKKIKKFEEIEAIVKKEKFKTFKIQAKRSDKTFKLNSQKINEQVGDLIRINLKKKVQLSNPDLTIYLEIIEGEIYIYTEKIKGAGGLPVGVSGKLVSLLSSGIDSPVASYLMMKRGAKIIFTHFLYILSINNIIINIL